MVERNGKKSKEWGHGRHSIDPTLLFLDSAELYVPSPGKHINVVPNYVRTNINISKYVKIKQHSTYLGA